MTTIIYMDGKVVTDSQADDGVMVMDHHARKCIESNGDKFFIAGAVCDFQSIIDAFQGRAYSSDNVELNAIVSSGDKVYHCALSENHGFWREDITDMEYMVIGSGMQFAFGALDAGCSAVAACQIAIDRDLHSGGKVEVYQL